MTYRADAEGSVCFTGHRFIPAAETEALRLRLRKTIEALYERGFRTFLCGGALGFDTLAGLEVLSCRRTLPELRLRMVLPCRSQSARWAPRDQAVYATLLSAADQVLWLSEDYYDGCMLMRNRYLVAHASLCVCYLKDRRGGTLYTVACAAREGLEIINLALEEPKTGSVRPARE